MKKLTQYLKILITIGIVVFFIYYFINNRENFNLVMNIDRKYLITLLLLNAIPLFLNGLFIKVVLKSFDKSISVFESFYVSVISSLGNYFLPMRGGAVIRSVYLKKKFDFSYSHFISTLYGNYIVVFLINALIALVALVIIQSNVGVVSLPLYIFFGVLFFAMLALSLFSFPTEKIKGNGLKFMDRIVRIIKDILEGWNIIIKDKRLLLSLLLLTFGNFIVMTGIFFVEFKALGIESNFINILLYNCLSGVSLLVSLTPGSLGIREGIFAITSDILGITNDQIMQLALLDRGTIIIVLLILFVMLFLHRVIKENVKT